MDFKGNYDWIWREILYKILISSDPVNVLELIKLCIYLHELCSGVWKVKLYPILFQFALD
jgi:hypothetical protein